MNHKIKIQLDKDTVRLYCWEKTFFVWGKWICFKSIVHGNVFEAYVDYENKCRLFDPSYEADLMEI